MNGIYQPYKYRQIGFWLIVIWVGALLSCRMARMAVPESLTSDAAEMEVKGRQRFSFKESLSFGPFRITDVDRGWTQTSSSGSAWFSSSKAKQSYEFTLRETNSPTWEAQCATGVNKRELNFDDFLGGELEIEMASVYFACSFKRRSEKGRWRLVMSQSASEMVLNGILTDGKERIQINGSQKLQGSPIPLSDPTGYEFVHKKRIIGAVEVINKGGVWILPSIDSEIRSVLAAASSALLLYRDISDIE